MISKCTLRHEQRLQCLFNCRFYGRCITRMGRQCKHLGGHRIPVFRSLYKEDFEDIAKALENHYVFKKV